MTGIRNKIAHHFTCFHQTQQQTDGPGYTASNVSYQKTEKGFFFSMNIDKAYSTGVGLAIWKRAIEAAGETLTIADSFKAKSSVSLTQSFMAVCYVDITEPQKIIFTTANGNKLELAYGREWEISKEIIPLISEEDQGLRSTWHDQPITRILLKL